jgi:hypothetical protein
MPETQVSYVLDDGAEINREHPGTYAIPPARQRNNLQPGQLVKLVFRISHEDKVDVERMWVVVKTKHSNYYVGVLDNDAYCTDKIASGLEVRFDPRHVIQIYRAP